MERFSPQRSAHHDSFDFLTQELERWELRLREPTEPGAAELEQALEEGSRLA